MPVPIALLVDDSCPLVHVYRYHVEHVHRRAPRTNDGRPLVDSIPNSFLEAFCDLVQRYELRGKLSVVPAPAARGDIVAGVDGDVVATRAWIDAVNRRIAGAFDFSPEMITHDLTVDLRTGALTDLDESAWSQTQDRSALTPYVARALEYLRAAGLDATGVTSPWVFGENVESEYVAAIAEAQWSVFRRRRSWYFLHVLAAHASVRPWVACRGGGREVVSIPATVDDVAWRTIDAADSSRAFVRMLADEIVGADGRGGFVTGVIEAGGWPILVTHWQSLYSNGRATGLLVLEEVARRIRTGLGDRVTWASCTELADLTLAAGTPRPGFLPPIAPLGPVGG